LEGEAKVSRRVVGEKSPFRSLTLKRAKRRRKLMTSPGFVSRQILRDPF
jgi:hypothetical protein